jgi:hypothetical protein
LSAARSLCREALAPRRLWPPSEVRPARFGLRRAQGPGGLRPPFFARGHTSSSQPPSHRGVRSGGLDARPQFPRELGGIPELIARRQFSGTRSVEPSSETAAQTFTSSAQLGVGGVGLGRGLFRRLGDAGAGDEDEVGRDVVAEQAAGAQLDGCEAGRIEAASTAFAEVDRKLRFRASQP